VLAARVGERGHVLGVEPDPDLARNIQSIVRENGYERRVEVVQAAVARRQGEDPLLVRRKQPRLSHLLAPGEVAHENDIMVPTITFEDIARRCDLAPQFVKIDVEGSEDEVVASVIDWIEHTRQPRLPTLVFVLQDPNLARCQTSRESMLARLRKYYELLQVDPSYGGLTSYQSSAAVRCRSVVAAPRGTHDDIIRMTRGPLRDDWIRPTAPRSVPT
jgi:FkbM family methyltransferase